jgi:hypothetical protein
MPGLVIIDKGDIPSAEGNYRAYGKGFFPSKSEGIYNQGFQILLQGKENISADKVTIVPTVKGLSFVDMPKMKSPIIPEFPAVMHIVNVRGVPVFTAEGIGSDGTSTVSIFLRSILPILINTTGIHHWDALFYKFNGIMVRNRKGILFRGIRPGG